MIHTESADESKYRKRKAQGSGTMVPWTIVFLLVLALGYAGYLLTETKSNCETTHDSIAKLTRELEMAKEESQACRVAHSLVEKQRDEVVKGKSRVEQKLALAQQEMQGMRQELQDMKTQSQSQQAGGSVIDGGMIDEPFQGSDEDVHEHVRNAYLKELGREPDPNGRQAYFHAVRVGDLSLLRLHQELRQSEEGQTKFARKRKASQRMAAFCESHKADDLHDFSSEDLAFVVAHSHDIGATKVMADEQEVSALWERHGLILAPAHLHVPLPKQRDLEHLNVEKPSEMSGVDLNVAGQLQVLESVIMGQKEAFVSAMEAARVSDDASEFRWDNCCFRGADAQVYWSVVAHLQPKRILEVGAGWNTKLAANAARYLERNGRQPPTIATIDPEATGEFEMQAGFSQLLKQRVQDVELSRFEELEEGDILFIDSSHCVFIGSDVVHLFLEVLPRLRSGVWVHVHDIFLPHPYTQPAASECLGPPVTVVHWQGHLSERAFLNEQYLLQALLSESAAWEVVWAGFQLLRYHRDALDGMRPAGWMGDDRAAYESARSFWMRRR